MKNVSRERSGKTFEQALERLEEIVDALERGNVSLEKSVAYFEEGTKLIKECTQRLNGAEAKIQKLVSTEEGFRLEPLSFPDEEGSQK
ncbi:MAG: exodeoxyribonuclease VII small subunit [Candidatus Eisenbacteria bacterium]|nr:exodeoxyribonuclease VII small subunit [Candidatus Eisenbacteria bacterium]